MIFSLQEKNWTILQSDTKFLTLLYKLYGYVEKAMKKNRWKFLNFAFAHAPH